MPHHVKEIPMVHPRIRHAVLNGRQVLTVPGFDAMSRRVLIPRFADVAASVVLIAGIAKIVDLEVFARSLQEWSIVGTRAKAFIVLVVPLLEITCSLVLLLRIHRAIGGALLACLLIGFSSVYSFEWFRSKPPTCHCMGALQHYLGSSQIAQNVLIRNIVLVACVVAGCWSDWKKSWKTLGHTQTDTAQPASR
jgi:hypothetical protein